MKKATLLATGLALLITTAFSQKSILKKIPFQLVNNMMIVEASINGDTGSFIVDTGFPQSVINPRQVNHFKRVPGKRTASPLCGIAVKVDRFSWAGIKRQDMQAVAMNISHLESGADLEIMGIIGSELLQGAEVMFDFRNQVMLMYDDRKSWIHHQETPLFSLPFNIKEGLPVVRAEIGGEKLQLGLDIGSRFNLLRKPLLTELRAQAVGPVRKQQMLGFASLPEYFDQATLSAVEVEGQPFERMAFVFAQLERGVSEAIDGTLGLEFLARYRFSINYHKKEIYFWHHGQEITHRRI